MKRPYTAGFIFARGGSKGVPRKNIRMLAGKPLIAYSIQSALESKLIDRVIVSTDDEEIADIARSFGAEVPFMRPKELALDDTPELLAWKHAINKINELEGNNIEIFVSIPATSPLRRSNDIDACIEKLRNSDADVVITVKDASRNPYFNMVVLDDQFNARIAMPLDRRVSRRQDAPLVYDMTTVSYVARPDFILKTDSLFAGKIKAVVIPVERALDIDTEMDFQFAEFLLNENLVRYKI